MPHEHHHHHSSKNIKVAFFLNLAFTIFEIFGGLYVNSVAIISDAIHDLGDSLSLGTAWYLQNKSNQKANSKFSFGYARFSLLGALINSVILIIGSIFVMKEAVGRILSPEPTNVNGMLIFAVFGILVNGYAAWKMTGGKSLNEKVISWHLMEDVLGWVAVLITALVLKVKYIPFLDPALSLLITAYILWGVVKSLRKSLFIFLQGVPGEIDVPAIEREIIELEKVDSIHHTHVWSLEGEHHVFTAHVKLKGIESFNQIIETKANIKQLISKYHFSHYTIETELDNETCSICD